MVQFSCSSSICRFSAEVPDPPGDADAMTCPICGELALAELANRPAFRCERCSKIFRGSNSTQETERCHDCGGRAVRVGSHSPDISGPKVVVLSSVERKALAGKLATAFWNSPAAEIAPSQGGGYCDCCDRLVSIGTGYLTGPVSEDDVTPSIMCESCFDKHRCQPWDGNTKSMTAENVAQLSPVLRILQSLTANDVQQQQPTPETGTDKGNAVALFERLTTAEKRRALNLDEGFLQSVLKSRNDGAVVAGIEVDGRVSLVAIMSDDDIRQATEIVKLHKQAIEASEASEHQTSIECFERIVKLAPFDAISWMSLGVQHAFLHNGHMAVDCLQRALLEDPDNERIRNNLHEIRADFGIAGSQQLAEATATSVNTSSPTSEPEATISRADKARQHLSEFWNSVDMESDRQRGNHSCDCCETPIAVNAGCLVTPNSGKPLSVDVSALEAKIAPARLHEFSYRIAKVAAPFKEMMVQKKTDFGESEDRIRELAAESPRDTRLLLALGTIQFKRHKHDEAFATFTEAKRCAPADAVIHFHLGKANEQLGKLDRALRDYDRARRLDFTYANASKAYFRLERQLHASKNSSKAASKSDVEKLLISGDYEHLVRLGLGVVKGLAQIIDDPALSSHHKCAATVLSRMGECAVPELVRLIYSDKNKLVMRPEVIFALSVVSSDFATSVLRRAWNELVAAKKFDMDFQCVVAALLRTGDDDSRRAILKGFCAKAQQRRLATLAGLRLISNCWLEAANVGVAILADTAVAEALVERCREDGDSECRCAALQGLLFTRLADAPRVVAESLKDTAPGVCRIAVSVLRQLAEQHVPLALTGGTISSVFKRGDVWKISGWTGDDGAISSLIPLLGDGDMEVRKDAGQALGELGDLALPTLVATARSANREVRIGLGWVSQTMHDAGRRILADCGVKLTAQQRGQQVIKIESKSSSALSGDMLIPIPGNHTGRYLHRDKSGRDHMLQVVFTGSQNTLWGLDCDELIDGTTIDGIEHSKPGESIIVKSNTQVSDQVRKLNDALPNVWKAVKFSMEPCAVCGIQMPTSEDSDFMNLGFLGLLQNNPKAIATTVAVTAAYFMEATGPDFTNVNMMWGARTTIFNWASMQRCPRCNSWICKRCKKLPHDLDGCSLCTSERKRREEMPGLVCMDCFTNRRFEPWNPGRTRDEAPIIPAMPILRRDKATLMVKPFYEKWSVSPVAECAACELLMPTTSVMQPLLKRIAKETGQDYNASLDAIAKLYVMILGSEVLGEATNTSEQEQLIQKLHLSMCQYCGKLLCPACEKLGSTERCVVCRTN